MNKLTIAISIFALALNGCATSNTSNHTITSEKPLLSKSRVEAQRLMIGKWYGSQPTKSGGKKEEITEHLSDGTYKIRFKVQDPGKEIINQIEIGQWGVSGSIYFSIFRGWVNGDRFTPSSPSNPYNYDAYRIITLNSEIFRYEHVATGNQYTIKKVPETFEFPK